MSLLAYVLRVIGMWIVVGGFAALTVWFVTDDETPVQAWLGVAAWIAVAVSWEVFVVRPVDR